MTVLNIREGEVDENGITTDPSSLNRSRWIQSASILNPSIAVNLITRNDGQDVLFITVCSAAEVTTGTINLQDTNVIIDQLLSDYRTAIQECLASQLNKLGLNPLTDDLSQPAAFCFLTDCELRYNSNDQNNNNPGARSLCADLPTRQFTTETTEQNQQVNIATVLMQADLENCLGRFDVLGDAPQLL